jgi:hypothetical protein
MMLLLAYDYICNGSNHSTHPSVLLPKLFPIRVLNELFFPSPLLCSDTTFFPSDHVQLFTCGRHDYFQAPGSRTWRSIGWRPPCPSASHWGKPRWPLLPAAQCCSRQGGSLPTLMIGQNITIRRLSSGCTGVASSFDRPLVLRLVPYQN